MDIRDLKTELAKSGNADIKSTYAYLIQASEHHLQAFVQNLKRMGITYTPVVLTKVEFDAILQIAVMAMVWAWGREGEWEWNVPKIVVDDIE